MAVKPPVLAQGMDCVSQIVGITSFTMHRRSLLKDESELFGSVQILSHI